MIEYYRQTFIDLFERIQAIRKSPWSAAMECYEVQLILMRKLVYVERRIQRLRGQIRALKKELTVRQSKEFAHGVRDAIEALEWQVANYKHVRFVFKSVGDAIAHIYLPPWDIKPLSYKESPGFISGKTGLQEERRRLRKLTQLGLVGILNDLTNDLRYGDITIIFGEDQYAVHEVKSGGEQSRSHPKQEAKLRSMANYMLTDVAEDLFVPGYRVVRIGIHAEPTYHVRRINETLQEAQRSGSSFVQPEDGVIYYAAYRIPEASAEADFENMRTRLKAPVLNVLNESKYNNMGYRPFGLTIEDPHIAYDFYAGNVVLMVAIDIDVILARFRSGGLDAKYLNDGDWSLSVVASVDDARKSVMRIGWHIFGRLFYEFLSLDWFVQEMIQRSRLNPDEVEAGAIDSLMDITNSE